MDQVVGEDVVRFALLDARSAVLGQRDVTGHWEAGNFWPIPPVQAITITRAGAQARFVAYLFGDVIELNVELDMASVLLGETVSLDWAGRPALTGKGVTPR